MFASTGKTRQVIVAGIISVMIFTAGCTPHPTEPSPTPTQTTSSSGAQLPGERDGVVGATALPEDIPDAPDIRASTHISSCTATDDGWEAEGTVRNPTDTNASYAVAVFFNTTTATVIGSGQATVDVPAGAERPWQVQAVFTAPEETLCALRGAG
jgi:hypothetical protein